MRNFILIPAVSALSLALAACASKPNPNLEQARSAYNQLQSDPQALVLAPQETKDAGDMLTRADLAFKNGNDTDTVDEMAYVTNKRIQVAQETIRMKTAEQQLSTIGQQRTQARLDARTAQVDSLLGALKPQQTDRGTLVTLGDVLFEFDKADLTANGMTSVMQLANFLKQHSERQVMVEGFTDNVGSDSYNLQLSQRRADAVKMALVRDGIAPQRIMTQGYGKADPVAPNDSDTSRALNRRVEVTISPGSAPVQPRVITTR
jgi:outer membrane protein OmpA-like peptidoglycan-associated protein